jgi:hypothetical protein
MSLKSIFRASCIFSILLLHSAYTNAQTIKRFSEDSEKFLSELIALFEEDSRLGKKVARAEVDTFAGLWLYGNLSKEQKAAVMKTANTMLKRKMVASLHFQPYLEAVQLFAGSSQSEQSFLNWDESLDNLAQKNTARFLSYLTSSSLMVSQGIISKGSGVEWRSTSMNFSFELEGKDPKIVFPELDLIAYAHNDSSIIHQTSGVYYPMDQVFMGGVGRLTWERAGFPASQVYAEFQTYKLDLEYSRFRIDSVNFFRKDLFAQPMLGHLVENVQYFKSTEETSYPQFYSFNNQYEIPNLFPSVDYKGGYSQRGSKLTGSGTAEQKAEMIFKKDGQPFVILRSGSFLIRTDRISSEVVELVIRLEEDSIYHPGLQMRYIDKSRMLSVFRGGEGLALSPFIDTYHGFDFYVEEISWNLDGNRIVFKMMEGTGNAGEALFESTEFFSRARYDRIQGLEQENPLNVVRRFCNSFGIREFTLDEFSRYMKFDPVQIKMYLLNLATMGFLHYDLDQDYIRVNDRLFRYVDAVNKKVDYDVIQLNSEVVDQENAFLSLLDLTLTVNGVSQVLLSDSQQVMIYPEGRQITVRRNRDLSFAGRIHAGMFDFFGKNFYFAYDKFEIALPVIDSVSFSVRGFEEDASGWAPLHRVKTVIQDINGNILVDRADNKSGLASLSQYPVFNCKEYSFAYYDHPSIYGGVYHRNTFYYRLNPFSIDSLDNFSTSGLRFKGVFVSAGIFPDLYDDLRIMPDYSLGLESTAQAIKTYGGKSKFNNRLHLSNEGLHGEGKLEYATSKSVSKDFVFFPDSTLARLESFDVTSTTGKPGFADAKGSNIDLVYYPNQDRLLASTVVKPFSLYKDFVSFTGCLTVRPSSMSGSGTMSVLDAEIDSRNFLLGQVLSDADTCDFRLKATYAGYKLGEGDTEGWELMTYNYKAKIDFNKKEGEFRSNGGLSVVMFTINQYMSAIDRFDWDMDSDNMQLYNEKASNLTQILLKPPIERLDAVLSGAEFISTHPRQDSLRFYAQSAVYSRKDNVINAKGVPFIRVADAAIFPAGNTVSIHRRAEMAPLNKALVIANVETRFHHFFDADISITGKLYYSGTARYNYTDAKGLKQPIKFDKIEVNQVLETEAAGSISDSAGFRLSPYFLFAGKVQLTASEAHLLFDGGTRLEHLCSKQEELSWLKFSARIDPAKVEIPVSSTPLSTSFGELNAAIMSTSDSVRVYTAFIDKKLRGSDKSLISANGVLIFDEASSEYRIASKDKLADIANPGNYLSLNTKTCNSFATGRMDLGTDFGQVKMDVFGRGTLYARYDSLQFDLAMLINFFFSEKALELMVADLAGDGSLGGVDLKSEVFNQALMDLSGKTEAARLMDEVNLYGAFSKVPLGFDKTLVLTDVAMHYDTRRRSYISEGPIGIVNIGKEDVYRSVNGRIEILRNRSDDEFTIYLELNPSTWYFFTYERGRLMAISTNEAFNTAIRDTDPEKRRLEVESGQTPYVFMLTTVRSQKAFKRKYGDSED